MMHPVADVNEQKHEQKMGALAINIASNPL
jgi:hypothetical protein